MNKLYFERCTTFARDGAGNFSVPYPDFVAGTTVNSSQVDDNNSHIAAALTASVAADGQTTRTANHQMNGFRHTGVGNSSARTMYAATGQVQDGSFVWGGTAGGTANALTLTLTPSITAYATGQTFRFIGGASPNTTAATINVNSVGNKDIQLDGSALVAGDIATGKIYQIVYDGTQFQLAKIASASIAAASDTVAGKVELATTAETTTGTDATRAVTPDGLHDMTSLAGAAWFLDEDTMSSNSDTKTVSQQSLKAYADALTGRIRQIVQASITGTFTTTSTTYTDVTGVTLNITPSSASSKVLILCFGAYGMSTAGNGTHITLVRDSTEIIRGDAASNRVRATTGGDTAADGQIMPFSITYLDSPATTSATTYKLQIRAGSGGTAALGRAGIDSDNADSSRVPTVIIALEYL